MLLISGAASKHFSRGDSGKPISLRFVSMVNWYFYVCHARGSSRLYLSSQGTLRWGRAIDSLASRWLLFLKEVTLTQNECFRLSLGMIFGKVSSFESCWKFYTDGSSGHDVPRDFTWVAFDFLQELKEHLLQSAVGVIFGGKLLENIVVLISFLGADISAYKQNYFSG